MDRNRLSMLLQVHSHFVDSAKLPENVRPWSIQTQLSDVAKAIMEEINPVEPKDKKVKTEDDNIPF